MSDTAPVPAPRREAFPEDADDPVLAGHGASKPVTPVQRPAPRPQAPPSPVPPEVPVRPVPVPPSPAQTPVAPPMPSPPPVPQGASSSAVPTSPTVAPDTGTVPAQPTASGNVPSPPGTASAPASPVDDKWQAGHSNISATVSRHKAFHIGRWIVAGIAVILLGAIAFMRFQQSAFSPGRVTLQVEAPGAVDPSQEITVTVAYANNNRVALSDAEVRFYYPAGFQLTQVAPGMVAENDYIKVSVGTIAAHAGGKFDVTGRFGGASKTVGYMKAVLQYTPENISSSYESSGQAAVTLQSSSLSLDVEAPLETASGAVAAYTVSYTNLSDTPLVNIRLKATYPEGFTFTDSDPGASEGETVWYLGTLSPHQSGTIHINGLLTGEKDDTKVFHVDAGVLQGDNNLSAYASAERTTRIVTSPLAIQQTVNGVVKTNGNPGQALRYVVSYRNDGPQALRNVVITFEMRSRVLDFSGLESDGGTFDQKTQTMTWKSSDIPRLANLLPGDSGSFRISVPVMAQTPFGGDSDKNPTVVTVAKIDSPDVPNPTGANKTIGSNTLTVRVNSKPSILVRTAYDDSVFANTGPKPPVVGQETTYSVHWRVTNTTNDLKNTQVVGELAPNVRWMGKVSPDSEHVTYDERLNRVIWDLGGLDSGAGTLRPEREITFQVGITPAPNQSSVVMTLLPLMKSTALTGIDTFTNETLTVPFQPTISTALQ